MNYLVSIQKNEHCYIQEWFTHHKQIGFDKIVVFNNSSIPYNINDPTYQEFDVSTMEAPQPHCYQWFYDNIMQLGDTATILDGDEFLTSELKINEIWNKFPNANCLRFSWQVFGDCGQDFNDDRPVQERFHTPAPIDVVYNDTLPSPVTENWHTKYSIKKLGPAHLSIHNALCNGLTLDMNGNVVNQYTPWIKPVWNVAYIKHFITKSRNEFIKRRMNKEKDATGGHILDSNLIRWYENLNGRKPI